VEFPIRITFVTSQDYQTRQLKTEEGNLIGPIRTRHNAHTHTGNTRQPEPQLKSSSCSSAIPSHNSRHAILSHNSRKPTFEISSKSCRPRTSKQAKTPFASAISPGAAHELPDATHFEIALRGTRVARR